MTPPTATAGQRRDYRAGAGRGRTRSPTPRRRKLRRRRVAGLLAVLALTGGLIALVPLLHHAVRDLTLPLSHASVIRAQAHAERLDPALVAGVVYAESTFRDDGPVSSAGAVGLMQIEPGTASF